MKWTAGLLAALVLAMPVAFAQSEAQAATEAETVSVFGLRFKQIGQGFSDFVFHIRAALTLDEKAKIELLKERNAEMQARQQAWIETKETALAQFRAGELSADEKREITGALQAEHEAIIKEHLRLTSEMRQLQLKAKARGDAALESRAAAAADASEESDLDLGLKLEEKFVADGTKVKVKSDVALSSEVRAAINKLVESFAGAEGEAELELKAEKEDGAVTAEADAKGELTAEQKTLWSDLQSKVKAMLEASAAAEAEVEIEIEHELDARAELTAEGAKEIVSRRLGFESADVRTETRGGTTFFVVTGEETETAGSFELTKSFEAWVESSTGLITSVDLDTHIESRTQAGASGGASGGAGGSAPGSASAGSSDAGAGSTSSSAGTSGSTSAGAGVSGGASGSAGTSGSAGVDVSIG